MYHILKNFIEERKKVGIFFDFTFRSDPDPESDPDQKFTDPQHCLKAPGLGLC